MTIEKLERQVLLLDRPSAIKLVSDFRRVRDFLNTQLSQCHGDGSLPLVNVLRLDTMLEDLYAQEGEFQ